MRPIKMAAACQANGLIRKDWQRNCTGSTQIAATTAPAVTLGGAANVELKAIIHDRDVKSLVVHFTDGRRNWMVQCRATQVQTFARFLAAVADAIGLWIEHGSQCSRHARVRSEDWQVTVAHAFSAGVKK